MSTQAKTRAREKRHTRWLARTTRQRAQGEDRQSDERDEEGMTTLDYLVGMREFREKSKGLQTLTEKQADALEAFHPNADQKVPLPPPPTMKSGGR